MSREREEFDEIGKKLKTEIDGHNNSNSNNSNINPVSMGRRHMLGPPGTLNTITPCAACKLLRRRCAEECPFSPYFSPHEPHKFAAVHKVFGASNEVPEFQRADAANSLVYEANVRLRDPVYGCMGAVSALQQQVQTLQAELNAVRAEILRYKYREAANTIIASTHAALAVSVAELPQAPPTPTPSPPAPAAAVPPTPPASAPSMYARSSSTASYTSISNNHLPYFD
ncbi:LOB domain-containing protein 15 [Phtheirospermum japonicum]|uniref:LOB domain-containing protein 15 n=1 Tax=Phtheirospermum japonicum TaxID=374723 RepID=A0A830AZQ4_9LAMI|nr:LOB domain-containing protein 15 [Phtheirospermum japonicum]